MIADTNQIQSIRTNAKTEQKKPVTNIEWGEFYSHLQEGYRNAQETIRAMDTKVSILTGLSVFALTVVGGVVVTATSCFGDHPEYLWAAVTAPLALLGIECFLSLSIVVSLTMGMICIVSCLGALRARNRIDGLTDLPATILFPHLYPREKLTTEQWLRTHQPAKEYYERIVVRNFTADDIQKEYHDQILNVGAILGEKVAHFQCASHWFRYQMISTGAVLALLLLTIIGIGIVHRHTIVDEKYGIAASSFSVGQPDQPALRHVPQTTLKP